MFHGEKELRCGREKLRQFLINIRFTSIFSREEYWILLLTIIYAMFFSYFTILRMYALSASAWDLGNYNQAIYTTLFNGKLFYYTPDLPANPSGSLFGVHFSPSLAVLFPFYLFYPKPETLLVFQSFVLGAGSFPVYWLARDILCSKRWGLLFAVTYLLNSALWGINWFDFHPEAFIPISMLLIIHFFYNRSWLKLAIASVFALGIMEQVPVLMIILSLYFASDSKDYFFSLKRNITNKSALLASLILLFMSLFWLLASIRVIQFLSPESPLHFGRVTSWEILGASNFLQIPSAILTNPIGAFNALSYDITNKALYLISIVGAFGFLSIFAPKTLFLTVPWLAVGLFSNNPVYYTLGVQYPAFILPFIAFASILGLRNLHSIKLSYRFSRLKLPIKFRKEYLVCFAFAFLILSNPFAGLNVATFPYTAYGIPSISTQDESAIHLVEMIPSDASVLVPQHLFPLVSSRLNAYTPPTSAFMPPGSSFISKLEDLIERSDYIILDLSSQDAVDAIILSRISGRYGVIASLEGLVLLKNGYTGDLQSFTPYTVVRDYRDLIVKDGQVVSDPNSFSGFVVQNKPGNSTVADLWWGPFVQLPPGNYLVTYRLKAQAHDDKTIANLLVNVFNYRVCLRPYGSTSAGYLTDFAFYVTEKTTLSRLAIKGTASQTEYLEFSTNFTANVFGAYEFPGMNVLNDTSVSLDRIVVQQIEALGYITPIELQFEDFSYVIFDSEHISNVFALMKLIPPGSSLVIQNNLYSLYSNLQTAYPLPPVISPEGIRNYIKSVPNEVEFVLFDWNVDVATASEMLDYSHLLDDFGFYAWAEGKILLKRGYVGATLLIEHPYFS